jgi:MOSC domain-containing protein YiiM
MKLIDVKDALSAVAEDLIDRVPRPGREAERRAARGGTPAMTGRIHQLNRSDGGVPKLPVEWAVLTETGLAGDRQRFTAFHGGPERALSLFSLELIERLRAEGHPISPGSTGENVTVSGLDWSKLAPGSRLALGDEVVVEVTSYAAPCGTIRPSFAGGKFKRISQKVNPGSSRLYARVLRAGRLAAGQEVRVLNGDAPGGGRGVADEAGADEARAGDSPRAAEGD